MAKEIQKELAIDMARQFDAGLAKIKYELQKNLNDIDPLDKERLSQLLSVFNQRLIVFQHEYLEYLARAKGMAESRVEEFSVSTPSTDKIPELASAILAGGASAFLVALIPVGTSGFWFWATTVTAAASAGAALGVPAGVVTAGAGVVVGGIAGIVAATLMKSKRRSLIRKVIMQRFDNEIVPKLRQWALNHIGT